LPFQPNVKALYMNAGTHIKE